MNDTDLVGVCSRSFSTNPVLRAELLRRYSKVKFNDTGMTLSGDSLVTFLSDCDKAITALETLDESVLCRLPKLKVIGKYGVGLDMLDKVAMHRLGIRLGWRGGVNKRSVSELVISFAISMLRHVPQVNQEVKSGIWRQTAGGLLSGRVVGVIGCGHVGKDLVKLLRAFDCKVLTHDILDFPDFYQQNQVTPVSLEVLLEHSDVVSLHVPLDSSTQGMLSAKQLALMKPGSVLINLARGGLVDELALKNMLIERKIIAAAFDVFAHEPPHDIELLNLPNFLATPHIGGSAHEAILEMGRSAIQGLDENFTLDALGRMQLGETA